MAQKPPSRQALARARAEGNLKKNSQQGNPRAGREYVSSVDAKGRKVHNYFKKDGTLDKAVVVKGAIDEAKKRSTIPQTKYSKKKPNRIKGTFGGSGRNRVGFKN